MRKQLLFVLSTIVLVFITTIKLNAQTGNEVLGDNAAPGITTGNYNTIVGDEAGTALTTSSQNTLLGYQSGRSITAFATDNVFVGYDSGLNNLTGDDNVFIGSESGYSNTSGSRNLYLGSESGYSNTRGRNNLYLGSESGYNNISGSDNLYLGYRSGYYTSTGYDNIVIGKEAGGYNDGISLGDPNFKNSVIIGTEAGNKIQNAERVIFLGDGAGYSTTTGARNVFLGYHSGYRNTTGNYNVFVGDATGVFNTEGRSNTFVGGLLSESVDNNGVLDFRGSAGDGNTTGVNNSFFGAGAGTDNGTGSENTFIGGNAGARNEFGDYNTFIGFQAGVRNNVSNSTTNASNNTFVGWRAGAYNEEGANNIVMGYNAGFVEGNDGSNNSIVIGYEAKITGSTDRTNNVILGANASVEADYAVAIGAGATTTTNNSMVLGGVTTTDRLSVGIATATPNQNASLELADTDKGFLVNRITTVQRTAMETAAANGSPLATTEAGMMVYDTDLSAIFLWNGTQWVNSTIDTDTDTDDQTIDEFQLNGDDLELSLLDDAEATKTVDLSKYLDNTDGQNLTSATLANTVVTIAIENGSSVSVDLSGILTPLQDENTAQQTEIDEQQAQITAQQVIIDDLIDRIEALETNISGALNKSNTPILYQNIPNPFNGTSTIKYYLPSGINNASIVFSNSLGQVVSTIAITQSGDGELNINSDGLASGTYFYTLYVRSKGFDSKKMVIE